MKTLQDLFLHNLREMYYVEKFMVGALEKLQAVAASDNIRQDLLKHKEETVNHIENIELVFALLDFSPKEEPSEVWKDMSHELNKFFTTLATDQAADFFVLEAAIKAERLEITNYEALILLAKEINFVNNDIAIDLFRQNLRDEENALSKAQSAMKSQLPLLSRSIH